MFIASLLLIMIQQKNFLIKLQKTIDFNNTNVVLYRKGYIMTLEVNGPSNIVILVRELLSRQDLTNVERNVLLKKIEEQALKTIKYMKEIEKADIEERSIKQWSDIR